LAANTAVYQAVKVAGPTGVFHDELALREVLAYRVYQDLRRGWRVKASNLEQASLLKIDYISLRDLCQAEEECQQCHPLPAMLWRINLGWRRSAPETPKGFHYLTLETETGLVNVIVRPAV
jgi:hypothetical protein